MNGLRDYCTKWSQSDRERQLLYDITYAWNLKNNTNGLTKQKQTHIENKRMVTKGEGREGWIRSVGLTDTHHCI